MSPVLILLQSDEQRVVTGRLSPLKQMDEGRDWAACWSLRTCLAVWRSARIAQAFASVLVDAEEHFLHGWRLMRLQFTEFAQLVGRKPGGRVIGDRPETHGPETGKMESAGSNLRLTLLQWDESTWQRRYRESTKPTWGPGRRWESWPKAAIPDVEWNRFQPPRPSSHCHRRWSWRNLIWRLLAWSTERCTSSRWASKCWVGSRSSVRCRWRIFRVWTKCQCNRSDGDEQMKITGSGRRHTRRRCIQRRRWWAAARSRRSHQRAWRCSCPLRAWTSWTGGSRLHISRLSIESRNVTSVIRLKWMRSIGRTHQRRISTNEASQTGLFAV